MRPDPTDIARAVSVQSGDKLAPDGATAANQLGLSAQVPAKTSYAITGRSRVKCIAGRSLTLWHSHAPVIDNAPESVNTLVQALAQLGRGKVDDVAIRRLATRIDDRDLQILTRARPQMPGWMGDAVLKMGAVRHG